MFSVPTAAQEDPATSYINSLAQSLLRDNERFGNVTYWVGGTIGTPNSDYTGLEAGDSMPEFEFAHMRTDDILDNNAVGPYVLNFWASWCPPCRAEFPRLLRDMDRLPFPVYFVNVFDRPREAETFLQVHEGAQEVYIDENDGFADANGLGVIPQTYLIDAEGNIQAIHVGELTEPAMKFLAAIALYPGIGSFED